jgi:hypothetical protein
MNRNGFSARSTRMAAVLTLLGAAQFAWGQVQPLARAHSHNDYRRPRPLLDALAQGFCSVEADVFLVEGALLVGHDLDELRPERTLRSLYLEPLRARVREHGGKVFEAGCEFTLLIDVKSDGESVWPVLRALLSEYREMLTVFRDDGAERRAVTVIISGNRAASLLLADNERLAGLDGRLSDLNLGLRPSVMPWISDNWEGYFKWSGKGKISRRERERLVEGVETAHRLGYRVRFWGAPARPAVWEVLRDAGVDLINTDDLIGLSAFLCAGREGRRP